MKRAYIDIETSGWSSNYCDITVVGIGVQRGGKISIVQIVGDDICESRLTEVLEGVERIYSFNGSRFDLPFIKRRLNVDIRKMVEHKDLMYDCWKRNLKGGLKAVERRLGIKREHAEIDGFMAVRLWWRYCNDNDLDALDKLLLYNRQDVANLEELRLKLGVS
ncbi:MAG: ribonuclease H-like domain-containing protein [Phycisphaerae bacterium]|jgi:hypothetical protein